VSFLFEVVHLIRVFMDEDGDLLFVAKDAADALGSQWAGAATIEPNTVITAAEVGSRSRRTRRLRPAAAR
jgi:hypothetical protein